MTTKQYPISNQHTHKFNAHAISPLFKDATSPAKCKINTITIKIQALLDKLIVQLKDKGLRQDARNTALTQSVGTLAAQVVA